MSQLEERADLLGSISGQIDESRSTSGSSAQEAEQFGAAGLSADSLVEGPAEIGTQLDAPPGTLASTAQRTGQIKVLTLSMAGND